jgi:LTXXQ motif family protein
MRPKVGLFALIVLVSASLATAASAQRERHFGGGGGGGPHFGGGGGGPHFGGGGGGFAAPHISAPSPHFSAPRISGPHFAAPAAHFAAPHIATHMAAQHFARAPRYTAPHIAARRFGAPHVVTHRSVVRHITSHRPSIAARHVTPTRKGVLARRNIRPRVSPNIATSTGTKLPTTTASRTGVTHGTVASNARRFANARQLTLNTPQTKHLQMRYTGGAPVLRNTTLASLTSRNAETRSLTQSTFRGNFAQSNWGNDWGWRHHHHHFVFGFVLGFVGPVFWPYAYDDCIDYLFWPYAYDTFWPYAFDDVFQGIYGAYAPEYYAPEDVYAYAGAPASSDVYSSATGVSRPSAALPGGSQICSGQTQGLTDFPIERIAQQVNPDQHQQALLDDLKAATAKAVSILQASCPNELPSTPTARLTEMRSRVEAMLQAVQVVRPTLDAFYSSLSDEQKERFNTLDEDINSAGQQVDVAGLCTSHTIGLPVARIERILHLSVRQDNTLKDLNDVSAQAANTLEGSCQQAQTLTPPGRLAAMENRLNSMLQAVDTVQPALVKFFGSLSDEQKARFDRLNIRPA